MLDDNGNPVMSSGNFAVVFKMKDVMTGRMYAVKCFTREQEGREEAYRQIADKLEFVQSTYLAKVRYYDHELFVDTNSSDDSEFPVLLMDWVEGETLDRYVRRNIDDFPAISILLSLRLIAADPSLLDNYGASDRLLFAESDYRDLSSCTLLKNVFPSHDVDINTLVSLFTIADMHKSLSHVSFRLLAVRKPQKPEKIEILSTEVTEDDLANAVEDEFGAKYSKDGKRLLKGVNIKEYNIKEGTKVICNFAFMGYKNICKINISNSVTKIGACCFMNCYLLKDVKLPNTIREIGMGSFFKCLSLAHLDIPKSVSKINGNPFILCKCTIASSSPCFVVKDNNLYSADMKKVISYRTNKSKIIIPNSIIIIGKSAFAWNQSIKTIQIPTSVKIIEDGAFLRCDSLQDIYIPDTVLCIGDSAFSIDGLKSIRLPYAEFNGDIILGKNKWCDGFKIIMPHGSIQRFKELLPKYKNQIVEETIF